MKQTIVDIIKDKKCKFQIGTFNKLSCDTIWINATYKICTNVNLKSYEAITKSMKSKVKTIVHNNLYADKSLSNRSILTVNITDTIKPNRTTYLKFDYFVKTKEAKPLNFYNKHIKALSTKINSEIIQTFKEHDFTFIK